MSEKTTDLNEEALDTEIKPFGGGLAEERDPNVGPTGRFARGSKPDGEEAEGGVAVATDPSPSDPRWTIDLDVFEGPFDLLITLVLNEEIDLLEVTLAEVVLAYIERLEARGELDLEAATEFLVLIAALLELKSRLMLPGEEMEGLGIEPQEAVEELLARLIEYRRYRGVADALHAMLAREQGYRYRRAPLPPELRRVAMEAAKPVYEPVSLRSAVEGLLRTPPAVDTSHLNRVTVSLERRLEHLRDLLSSRQSFSFDDAVEGSDRMTQAVTLFALLELYKSGELVWRQKKPFGRIEISAKES
jgi:segregation and condensation protein A